MNRPRPSTSPAIRFARYGVAGLVGLASLLTACEALPDRRPDTTAVQEQAPAGAPTPKTGGGPSKGKDANNDRTGNGGAVTLAFAGDVHFQSHLAGVLDRSDSTLGPMSKALSEADVAMVNLESAVSDSGIPDAKELERAGNRYWFRAPASALDVLDRSGVDVVTVANNHGADYGPRGLAQTLQAKANSPIAVVGVGHDRKDAFTPHRVSVKGTDFAFFGADSSMREGASSVWEAGLNNPGLAAAHSGRPAQLLAAVRQASDRGDFVVVYLHWGAERASCPTALQQTLARSLSEAGADIIVGSHAHVQLGAGSLNGTYVNYGLGNFYWYHNHPASTGVLQLRVKDGRVVNDEWLAARIPQGGGAPVARTGTDAREAVTAWERLRGCTGLKSLPKESESRPDKPRTNADGLPAYESSIQKIGTEVAARMTSSYRPECPVPLSQLRYLRMSYVDFDGEAHLGEMVVNASVAEDIADIFGKLYAARWPIARMALVDEYGGDDDESMAANNTSAFNCRAVAGTTSWSDHAYGTAIDINPLQNPYLQGSSVSPADGEEFVSVDRSPSAQLPAGVIGKGDVVHDAFTANGWKWGGAWSDPDYQHFAAPRG